MLLAVTLEYAISVRLYKDGVLQPYRPPEVFARHACENFCTAYFS
jgi:hypothetical protein